MPPEMLETLPGYGPDVAKNRAEAREIMEKLGYGPDKRLPVTVTTRNVPPTATLRSSLSINSRRSTSTATLERDRYDAVVSDGDAQGLCRRP